jgi:hypothetical protein
VTTTYKDVVLSPAADDATVAFTGTGQDERVTFDNPHQYQFSIELNLDGGDDQVTQQAFDLLGARVGTGAGADSASLVTVGDLTIGGGSGDDDLSVGSVNGAADARGGAGDDHVSAFASSGAVVHGGAGDDWIRADGSGGDSAGDAWGGAGNDYIEVRGQTVFADGGPGADVITGGTGYGADIRGGSGDDTVVIGGGGLVDGGDGDDTIYMTDVGVEDGTRNDLQPRRAEPAANVRTRVLRVLWRGVRRRQAWRERGQPGHTGRAPTGVAGSGVAARDRGRCSSGYRRYPVPRRPLRRINHRRTRRSTYRRTRP